MLHFTKFSTICALLLFASVAVGQRGQSGRMESGGGSVSQGMVTLTTMPEVQKELEFSREQQKLIYDLQSDVREMIRAISNDDNGSRRPSADDMRTKIVEINIHSEALLAIVLQQRQYQRLKEIRLQSEGAAAFDRSEFVKTLEVSEAQTTKIQEIRHANGPVGPRRRRGTTLNQRQKLLADIQEVLTDQQREKWEEMKGKPFSFPEPARRGGRRPAGI